MGTPGCRLFERESQTLDLHAGSAADAPYWSSGREPNVEIVYERVAAIDVGKKIIAVAVRTPGEKAGKRRQQERLQTGFLHGSLWNKIFSEYIRNCGAGFILRPVSTGLLLLSSPPEERR